MLGLWTAAGMAVAVGGALVTTMSGRGRDTDESARAPEPEFEQSAVETEQHGAWHTDLDHCERAVSRAERSVDTITDERVRQRLRAVVRRMDAEVPNVRALAELGRGLEATAYPDEHAVQRVRDQLGTATTRFDAAADHLVETVVDWVSSRDAARLDAAVVALRGRFPLLLPLSSLSARRPDSESLVRS